MSGPKGTFLTGPLRNKEAKRSLRAWFANLPIASDPDYIVYYNDFNKAVDFDTNDWTITTTEGGTGSATEAIDATLPAGVLVVTNDDADTDLDSLQFTGGAPWAFTSGKRQWFEVKAKMSSLTSTLFVGLAVTDTTPLDAANRVNFRVSTGTSGAILCQADSTADSAVSTSAGVSAVADTYVKLGWYYDGASTIQYFVDRIYVAQTTSGIPAAADVVRFTYYLANGATSPDAAKATSLDYIHIVQER